MNQVQKIMIWAAAAAMMASCSKGMDGEDGPDGNTPGSAAVVTAEVDGLKSRVANFTDWEANDAIGLSTSIDSNIPYVTTSGDGNFTPKGSDVLYINGASAVKVAGYYPHTETVTGNTISFDVVNDANADYMFAETTATRENPAVTFSFNHVMARLVFKFNVEIDSYSLKGLLTTGTFHIYDGIVTNGDTKAEISGTKTQEVATFIPPHSASDVKLSFVYGGSSYLASLPAADYKGGNQYTYTITLDGTDVAVTVPKGENPITGLTNTDMGSLTFTEQEPEMAVGDWYLSDGTTVSHVKTLTDEQKTKVIGVVVYKGNPSTTALAKLFNETEGAWETKCDPANVTVDYMATNYPGCTNGIVMAIGGRDQKAAFLDANTTTTITEWWNGQDALKAETMAPCADDIKNAEGTITSNRYFCLGLQNTHILEKYVEAGNSVAAIGRLQAYRTSNAAPTGTTGWYIPSPMEIAQFLFGNETDGVKAVINNSLKAVGASEITNDQYWSSSEGASKVAEGSNVNYWYFGRVKKTTGEANYFADLSKGTATSKYLDIYFLAF